MEVSKQVNKKLYSLTTSCWSHLGA